MAKTAAPKRAKITITAPEGVPDQVYASALGLGLSFSRIYPERPAGKAGVVVYNQWVEEVHYFVSVWWTKARAISVYVADGGE